MKTENLEVREWTLGKWAIMHRSNGAIIYQTESKEDAEMTLKQWSAAPELLGSLQELLDINESKEAFEIKVDKMVIAINNAKSAVKKATE